VRTERTRLGRLGGSFAALAALAVACVTAPPAVDVRPGTTVWSVGVATAGVDDEVLAVAVGTDGVVAFGGATRGDVGSNPNQGEGDGFVVLLEADGAERWRVQLGDAGDDQVAALAIRDDGVVVAVGTTESVLGGPTSAIVVGLDGATGATLWKRGVASPEGAAGVAVAVDASGVAFVAGHMRGDLPPAVNQGFRDAFLLRVTAAGDIDGYLLFGGSSFDSAADVVLLPGGDVVLVGATGDAVPGAVGTGQFFVARFAPDLLTPPAWVIQAGGDLDVVPAAAAVDPDGDVVVVGLVSGQLGADPFIDQYDVFVARLPAGGAPPAFVRQVGTAGYDEAAAVAVDAAGRVWVVGTEYGFGPGANTSDVVLHVFGPDDALLRREVLPVGAVAGARALALAGDREVVVGGWNVAAVPTDLDGFVIRRRY